MGASALVLHSPPPTGKEAISTSTHARTASTKEASASKSKYSSHFPLPYIFCYCILAYCFLFPIAKAPKKSKGIGTSKPTIQESITYKLQRSSQQPISPQPINVASLEVAIPSTRTLPVPESAGMVSHMNWSLLNFK